MHLCLIAQVRITWKQTHKLANKLKYCILKIILSLNWGIGWIEQFKAEKIDIYMESTTQSPSTGDLACKHYSSNLLKDVKRQPSRQCGKCHGEGDKVQQTYSDTLTHWGRDNVAAISWTTFSYEFSWMKMCEFGVRFHWDSFLRILLTIFQHWFR